MCLKAWQSASCLILSTDTTLYMYQIMIVSNIVQMFTAADIHSCSWFSRNNGETLDVLNPKYNILLPQVSLLITIQNELQFSLWQVTMCYHWKLNRKKWFYITTITFNGFRWCLNLTPHAKLEHNTRQQDKYNTIFSALRVIGIKISALTTSNENYIVQAFLYEKCNPQGKVHSVGYTVELTWSVDHCAYRKWFLIQRK